MNDPQTPDEARAKLLAELLSRSGPKPLKPIPPELMAEALAYVESEEEWERLLAEVRRTGGDPQPIEALLAELDRPVGEDR